MSGSTGGEVLVAGIGNLFLSDDAFGSEVARRLAAGPLPDGVRVVDYGIRGMHLAYDLLDGYVGLVVVDALPGDGSPGDLSVLTVGPDDLGESELDAHGMAPVSVLASLGQLGGTLPPTYLVGCQPGDTGDGMGLTPAVAAAVGPAVALVREVLSEHLGRSLDGPGQTDGTEERRPRERAAGEHHPRKGTVMRTIGIITTSVIVLVVLVGVVVGIRSVPDIKRYLHIRSM